MKLQSPDRHQALSRNSHGAQRDLLGLSQVRAKTVTGQRGHKVVTPWRLAYVCRNSPALQVRSQHPESQRLILDLEACVLAATEQERVSGRLLAAWAIAPDGRTLRLPGFSGLPLTRELQLRGQGSPVLTLTLPPGPFVNADVVSVEVDLEPPVEYPEPLGPPIESRFELEEELPPRNETLRGMTLAELKAFCGQALQSGDQRAAGWSRFGQHKESLTRFLEGRYADVPVDWQPEPCFEWFEFAVAKIQALEVFCRWRSKQGDEQVKRWSVTLKHEGKAALVRLLTGAYGPVFQAVEGLVFPTLRFRDQVMLTLNEFCQERSRLKDSRVKGWTTPAHRSKEALIAFLEEQYGEVFDHGQ